MRRVITFLILLLICILSFNYCEAIKYYLTPLITIVISGLVLWLIWNNCLKQQNLNFELFLTFSSILIAILLFFLQNLELVNDMNETLISTNKYNCNTSKELKISLTDSIKSGYASFDTKRRFITEPYKDNMAYLLHKLGNRRTTNAFKAIEDMDQSNRKLDIIQSTGSEYIYSTTHLGKKEDDDFKKLRNTFFSFSLLLEEDILDLASKTLSELGEMDKALGIGGFDECKE